MKAITVFTPTYNRAFCLGKLYQSLLCQTDRDFLWLVIDDGSTDDTKELVSRWIAEQKIEIRYLYQENQGMHSGHNAAYSVIDTELNVCIDSDDYLPENAIERILKKWKSSPTEGIAGLIGLDAFQNGNIVGTQIPAHLQKTTVTDLYQKHKVTGDKKLVIKTSVVKEFPLYPVFQNEKLVPLGILYVLIDQKYQWVCTNDVYCIIEYLADGSSQNILKQYQKSPKGFGYARLLEMKYATNFSRTFTRAMHYISSCLFQQKWNFFHQNPQKIITLMALPFGVAFHFYLLYKLRK